MEDIEELTEQEGDINLEIDVGENDGNPDVSETVDISKLDSEEVPEKILRLPVSRIKKIMKIDPDVSLASREAVFLITKATHIPLNCHPLTDSQFIITVILQRRGTHLNYLRRNKSQYKELLLDSLAKEAYAYTAGENKKTVTKKHLDSAISNIDALAFLDGALD